MYYDEVCVIPLAVRISLTSVCLMKAVETELLAMDLGAGLMCGSPLLFVVIGFASCLIWDGTHGGL